jgi:hypothetical protein
MQNPELCESVLTVPNRKAESILLKSTRTQSFSCFFIGKTVERQKEYQHRLINNNGKASYSAVK